MQPKELTFLVIFILLSAWLPVQASQDLFQPGMDAYERKDYTNAFPICLPFAEQGHVSAQYNLGVMYAYGRGIAQDEAKAVKWFQRAAEQGDADAQYRPGLSYADGEGIEWDHQYGEKLSILFDTGALDVKKLDNRACGCDH